MNKTIKQLHTQPKVQEAGSNASLKTLRLALLSLTAAGFLTLFTGCNSVSPNVAAQRAVIPRAPVAAPPLVQQQQQQNQVGGLTWSGQLFLSNAALYRDLLRAYRVCDQYSLLNLGIASCDAWDNSAQVTLTFDRSTLPSTATLTIRPVANNWSTFGRSQPSFIPLTLRGQAVAIRRDDGFQARLQGGGFVTTGVLAPVIVKSTDDSPVYNSHTIEADLYYGSTARTNLEFASVDLENPSIQDGFSGADPANHPCPSESC